MNLARKLHGIDDRQYESGNVASGPSYTPSDALHSLSGVGRNRISPGTSRGSKPGGDAAAVLAPWPVRPVFAGSSMQTKAYRPHFHVWIAHRSGRMTYRLARPSTRAKRPGNERGDTGRMPST